MEPDSAWAELDPAERDLIEELFHAALALPEPERAAFLEAQLGDRRRLLAELDQLLALHDEQERSGSWPQPVIAAGEFELPPAGQQVGVWRLERLLGEGGMGAVYLARRTGAEFEQTAALKMIACRLASPALRERFLLERQILARLEHPNIARLLDGGTTEEGDPYLVMEYVEGIPLDDYCRSHQLPVRRRLELFLAVCSAVHYAHQHLVIHRDLKPGNILVTADGVPKLLDFGTAKLLAEQLQPEVTQQGLRAFTPAYASPEVILGQAVTTASDVYSLGVVLYRILTGAAPYETAERCAGELLRAACEQEPVRPSLAGGGHPELAGDLDAIVLKAMRKRPAERYASVDQLAEDIRRYLDGRPVTARHGSLRYRALKFIRRNWLPLAAAGALALSLAAGIGGILWQAGKAEARYRDLRRLTNSLLFELRDLIRQLPGSTAAQRLLLTRVLDHLDKLAGEIRDDPKLQADLAEAYLQLGNLQGNPYEPNLGDVDGALRSLNKALLIARELRRAQPDDPSMARAEQAISEVLFGAGRTKEAVEHCQTACNAFEELLQRAGASASRVYEAAACYDSLGDQFGQTGSAGLGDLARARASYERAALLNRRALELDPHFSRARRAVAINRMKIAQLVLESDPQEAASIFREALVTMDAMPEPERQKPENRRARWVLGRRAASAMFSLGDYPAAAAEYKRVLDSIEPFARIDPENSQAQYDLAVVLNDLAETYREMGDTQAALRATERVREVLDRLLARDANNVVWRGHKAELDVRLAGLISGDRARAEALAKQGLAAARELAEAPGAGPVELHRAAQAFSKVALDHLRQPRLAVSYAKRAVELSGGKAPDFFLTLAAACRAAGDLEGARQAARQGLAQLAPLKPGARPSRLRRLLEEEAR